jgi:hypothetical protein
MRFIKGCYKIGEADASLFLYNDAAMPTYLKSNTIYKTIEDQ